MFNSVTTKNYMHTSNSHVLLQCFVTTSVTRPTELSRWLSGSTQLIWEL